MKKARINYKRLSVFVLIIAISVVFGYKLNDYMNPAKTVSVIEESIQSTDKSELASSDDLTQKNQEQKSDVASTFTFKTPGADGKVKEDTYLDDSLKNLKLMIQDVHGRYYKDVDDKKIVEALYKALYESLDQHSVYLNKAESKVIEESLGGEITGIGATVSKKDEYIMIVSPIKDSPAQKAGLKPYDLVTAVNGESTKGMALDLAVSKIRGKENTEVKLTIKRNTEEKEFDVTIKRARIIIKSVEYENKNGINYIKISSFDSKTADELKEILKKNPCDKGVVIDLRSNHGGYLDQAVEICRMFLKKDQEIVTIDYKSKKDEVYKTLKDGYTMPMVVLVNETSASASEIFTGAMQEHKRATIVGVKTYGKGTVQNMMPSFDGGTVKLTIAEYLIPNGKHINGVGITPDVIVDGATYEELVKDLMPMNSLNTSQLGSKDMDTLGLQQRLNLFGYKLTADGSFGQKTKDALIDFQKKNGLNPNGILDVKAKSEIQRITLTKLVEENDYTYTKGVEELKKLK